MSRTWLTGLALGLVWASSGGSSWAQFVAFNDHVGGASTHANATLYNVFRVVGTTNAGPLKEITSGVPTGVRLTLTNLGGSSSTISGQPNPGTPAQETFGGFVTFGNGAILLGPGQAVGHVLTGLDPNRLYSIKGTAVRGTYSDRWSVFELVGAVAFRSAHTAGCLTGHTNAAIASNQVVICTGDNRPGEMFDWEEVAPGLDGSVTIVSRKFTNSLAGLTNGTGSACAGEVLRVEETTLTQPARIALEPQDLAVCTGQPATMAVEAYGTPSLLYQWYKDGAPLPGATNPVWTVPQAGATDAGRYAVMVKNEMGSVTSREALLTVCSQCAAGVAYQVLVFSKTTDYRHPAISSGLAALTTLGALNNFSVVATEDAQVFTDANLACYRAVIFLLTSGEVLEAGQQAAFERYIRAGHGFVGIHSAAATEYDWAWYGGLIGAHFSTHPPDVVTAQMHVEDTNHPSTAFLPEPWSRSDEWYNFATNPRPQVRVLLRLDEATYSGGTMGDHPMAWCHEYDGGRAWFTGLGHSDSAYAEPLFRLHLLGGIQYAAGVPWTPPSGAHCLLGGTNTTQWVQAGGSTPIQWPVVNGTLQANTAAGNVATVETYQDFSLHVEFAIPASPPGTPELQLANSGIYLQGRYELQIIDSYGRALSGSNDGGSIWSLRDASVNASVPAEKWETYDLSFRAARWSGNAKTENARLTLYWNTVLVQNNVEITRSTDGGTAEAASPGPIVLQALIGPVRFRNLWVQGAIANPPTLAYAAREGSVVFSWPVAPGGFQLEATSKLLPDPAWTPVPDPLGLSNGRNVVTQQISPGARFFRLRRP